MVQDSAAPVQAAVLESFVDALTREFASPETAAVIRGAAATDELDPADHRFVGIGAVAYEDARARRPPEMSSSRRFDRTRKARKPSTSGTAERCSPVSSSGFTPLITYGATAAS